MKNPLTIPFEFPHTADGKYTSLLTEDGILKSRRTQLGMTQQEVADLAHIQLSQYQRLEAEEKYQEGTSMKIGLSVCAALLLNPYELISIDVEQPDPSSMRPQEVLFEEIPIERFMRKRVGRKPIRKEIMTVIVNHKAYSLLIPYDALNKLGNPPVLYVGWDNTNKYISVAPFIYNAENGADDEQNKTVDEKQDSTDYTYLAIPTLPTNNNPITVMGWGDQPHAVESRIVYDKNDNIALLLDLKTAVPTDGLPMIKANVKQSAIVMSKISDNTHTPDTGDNIPDNPHTTDTGDNISDRDSSPL